MNIPQHLAHIIALKARADNMHQGFKFHSLFEKNLSLAALLQKFEIVKEMGDLYHRAYRLAHKLELDGNREGRQLAEELRDDLKRNFDTLKVIREKANKWGFGDLGPAIDNTGAKSLKEMDANQAFDQNFSEEALRNEVLHSLKALANITKYMNKSNLLRIRHELNKIIGY